MGELLIKDVEDETIVQISNLARLNGRSVEHETLTLIREALGTHACEGQEDRAAMARRIAAMSPRDVIQTDSVILIREDRDR
ncbi:hypothetical protein [uncultured Methylobacterium sp.]|uniref:hypothetical protein n=1 Tax=uncultured Methylobacterium sp. TaxID=157278 RepID=UPI0035CBB691